ncbi:hypothetical protein E4T39_05800 [Aureobasidium subglaciale]|nr:hypothetical protein E4T39_05800 [Aureobasidium subglaciale]
MNLESSAAVGMDTPTQTPKKHSFTNILITISLQLLLWSSLFPLSIQISLFALSKVDASLLLADILCIAADLKQKLIDLTGWNIASRHPSTHFDCTASGQHLQQMGESNCCSTQSLNSLRVMHSSVIMDYNGWPGNNPSSCQAADLSASKC